MKVLIRFLSLVSFFYLVFSCAKKNEVSDDAIRFRYYNLENQGWKSKLHLQKIDNISYKAVEVPIQYYLLKEIGNQQLVKVDSLYEEYKKERIIEFNFEEDNKKDLLEEAFTGIDYQKSVEYMSFKIENDFYVVTTKKDTIKCSGVLFERNFKVAPYTKILLFFSGIDPEENIQLVYQDKLFRKGTVKFSFRDKILNL